MTEELSTGLKNIDDAHMGSPQNLPKILRQGTKPDIRLLPGLSEIMCFPAGRDARCLRDKKAVCTNRGWTMID